MKLISMTEKVLQLSKNLGIGGNTFYDFYLKTTYYANFLSQPLTLGMFVPCDENGNVLEEPKSWQNFLEYSHISINGLKPEIYEYQKAKDKVLFDGFYIIGIEDCLFEIELKNNNLWLSFSKNDVIITDNTTFEYSIKTIENIIKYDLTLTESAKQQFKQ